MTIIAQATQPISAWQMAGPVIGSVALVVALSAFALAVLSFRRSRYPAVSISGVCSTHTSGKDDFTLFFDVQSYGADIYDFRAALRCPEPKLEMIELGFVPQTLPGDEPKQIPSPFKNGQSLRLMLTLRTSTGSDVDLLQLLAREAMLAGTAAIVVEGNGRRLAVIPHDDTRLIRHFGFYKNCALTTEPEKGT